MQPQRVMSSAQTPFHLQQEVKEFSARVVRAICALGRLAYICSPTHQMNEYRCEWPTLWSVCLVCPVLLSPSVAATQEALCRSEAVRGLLLLSIHFASHTCA